MPSGRAERLGELPQAISDVIDSARRAVLTTVDAEGHPHAVPVVFAVYDDRIVTPIDRKPKTTQALGRRKNIARDPHVALLMDKWSEEWIELAWVMVRGVASVQLADSATGEVEAIIGRYPGYRDTLEASDVIQIVPNRILWWSWS